MLKSPWSEGLPELESEQITKQEIREAIDAMFERGDKEIIELFSAYNEWVKKDYVQHIDE